MNNDLINNDKDKILNILYGKDTKENYQQFQQLENSIVDSNGLYKYFSDFKNMLINSKSFIRVRGFRIICQLAKYDYENQINDNIQLLLKELTNSKPTSVRQCLKTIPLLIQYKKELIPVINQSLINFNYSKYKDTMIPLLKKDIKSILKNEKSIQYQLNMIADSYDRAIDLGRKGIDSYDNLPPSITKHPYYYLFEEMRNNNNLCDSNSDEIIKFLSPKKMMNFIDLGCCLNLMFRDYDKWPSTYYGVDISPKTIELLDEYTKKNNISIGSLYCGSMHEVPFKDNFFDIGACIGSLEYFEKDFIILAIKEMYRILKPHAKLVLDIPNVGTNEFLITSVIEKFLGREDKFDISIVEFDDLIANYFIITKKNAGPMILYFLTRKD